MDLNEQHPTPDVPRGGLPGTDPKTENPYSASRRAMLRAGLIGVPVVTTLMARPAWAQTVCFSVATAASVSAAGFQGSPFQRAMEKGQTACEPGPRPEDWQAAYYAAIETYRAARLEQLQAEAQMAAIVNGQVPESAYTTASMMMPTPSAEAGAVPEVHVTLASMIAETNRLDYVLPDGTMVFLGTFHQAFGRGPIIFFDEILTEGYSSERIYAAAFLNALNREMGSPNFRNYPLSIDEVRAFYAGDPVGGRQWSPSEAIGYLLTTLRA
ncbi:hypothetical protein [Caenispirillum bisanense]|uniref:hypothetical protein n=1 Tax=Caenispirillum bisanense TaxID=414052 RepID=UPI0031E1B5EA